MAFFSISGPPGSGKTTIFCEILKQKSKSIGVVEDIPRQAFDAVGLKLAESDPSAFQHYVGFAQYIAEDTIKKRHSTAIFDKSLVDALAYWRVLIGPGSPPWEKGISSLSYNMLFICDLRDIDLSSADEYQSMHWDIRLRIHHEIINIVHENKINYTILSGSVCKRVATAISHINKISNTTI